MNFVIKTTSHLTVQRLKCGGFDGSWLALQFRILTGEIQSAYLIGYQ